MQKNVSDCLTGVVAVGSVMFSMGATANPKGVPLADPTPLSCTTANYAITAMTGANGEFPVAVLCPSDPAQMCSDYGYTIGQNAGSSATISQALFAISAELDFDSANPSPANIPTNLGDGDSTTGFLKYTQHEYPIRFNSSQTKSVEAHIYLKGISSARPTTAYIRGGKLDESCLIAGGGIPRSQWTPLTENKTVVATGGKCAGTLHYNGKGEVVNITDVTPMVANATCYAGKPDAPPPGQKVRFVLGEQPIQDVNAPDGITFGTGTTTVYLPSGWAICTASPCPGTTTYKYTY